MNFLGNHETTPHSPVGTGNYFWQQKLMVVISGKREGDRLDNGQR